MFFADTLRKVMQEELPIHKGTPRPPSTSKKTEQMEEAAKAVKVVIKNSLDELMCELNVPRTTTIKELKYMVQDRTLVAPEQQKLFFDGHRMMDGPTLNDYGINDGNILHVHFKQRPEDVKKTKNSGDASVLAQLPHDVLLKLRTMCSKAVELFEAADGNKDGILSVEDVKGAIYKTVPGVTSAHFDLIFNELDANSSGYIKQKYWLAFFERVEKFEPNMQASSEPLAAGG